MSVFSEWSSFSVLMHNPVSGFEWMHINDIIYLKYINQG